jgi:hypothetical protein
VQKFWEDFFMRRLLFALAILSVPMAINSAQAQETIPCNVQFRMTTKAEGEFPGALSTAKDFPCRFSRNLNGKARGIAPGRSAGMDIVRAPKNGKIIAEDLSSLVFTPKKGFTGSDEMVIRFKYQNGDSSLVRFAITVS